MPSKSHASTSVMKLLIQLTEVTKQKDTDATTNTPEFTPLEVQFLGYGGGGGGKEEEFYLLACSWSLGERSLNIALTHLAI